MKNVIYYLILTYIIFKISTDSGPGSNTNDYSDSFLVFFLCKILKIVDRV